MRAIRRRGGWDALSGRRSRRRGSRPPTQPRRRLPIHQHASRRGQRIISTLLWRCSRMPRWQWRLSQRTLRVTLMAQLVSISPKRPRANWWRRSAALQLMRRPQRLSQPSLILLAKMRLCPLTLSRSNLMRWMRSWKRRAAGWTNNDSMICVRRWLPRWSLEAAMDGGNALRPDATLAHAFSVPMPAHLSSAASTDAAAYSATETSNISIYVQSPYTYVYDVFRRNYLYVYHNEISTTSLIAAAGRLNLSIPYGTI